MNDVNNEILKKMVSRIENLNSEVNVLRKKVEENVGDVDYNVDSGFREVMYREYHETSSECSSSDISANELRTTMNYGRMVYDPRYEYYREIAKI